MIADEAAEQPPPDGISLERHRELRGRAHYVWVRRALLCAIGVLPVLALLNVFGQHPSSTSASSPAASLSVTAPSRLRSGLIFQVRVKVTAHRAIRHLSIAFDEGWFESMSVNSAVPEPEEERSRHGRVELDYGELEAGETFVARVYFQVNPTNVGDRRADVAIADGGERLVEARRSLTIFP